MPRYRPTTNPEAPATGHTPAERLSPGAPLPPVHLAAPTGPSRAAFDEHNFFIVDFSDEEVVGLRSGRLLLGQHHQPDHPRQRTTLGLEPGLLAGARRRRPAGRIPVVRTETVAGFGPSAIEW